DDTNNSYSYIVLWSIIERIVKNIFASDAEEKNKLKNTLKNIYEEDKILFNLISALYEKRNSMIHGGNLMDIELDDINWIKLIVCDLLSRTFRKLKDN
ncbi:MAG: HEPN domain-containing protein, partial [Nitrososphaerota archaeon]